MENRFELDDAQNYPALRPALVTRRIKSVDFSLCYEKAGFRVRRVLPTSPEAPGDAPIGLF
jgi:hypothetical protein